MLAAMRRASSLLSSLVRAPTGLVLEVEIPKRLTVLVADDERPPARRPTRAAGSGD
jgi:hypothetical protein